MVSIALTPHQAHKWGRNSMRRSLVLTDEAARHPFRSQLPRHVRNGPLARYTAPTNWRLSAGDMRGFATTYFATFAAVLAFIS